MWSFYHWENKHKYFRNDRPPHGNIFSQHDKPWPAGFLLNAIMDFFPGSRSGSFSPAVHSWLGSEDLSGNATQKTWSISRDFGEENSQKCLLGMAEYPEGHISQSCPLGFRFLVWENNEISHVFSKREYDRIKMLIMSLAQFTWKSKGRGQGKEWFYSFYHSKKLEMSD